MKKIITSVILTFALILISCAFGIIVINDDMDKDTRLMYSEDGRCQSVPLSEVEANSKVGWYENFSDVITTVWSEDGRSNVVFKADKNAYIKVGWYQNRSEVVTTLYRSKDDKEETVEVFNNEIEKYLADGWRLSSRNIDPDKPMVALTFDDGPNKKNTSKILDAFEKNGGRGTFYLLGSCIDKAPECIKRMKELGCEIGSHTYDHSRLTSLDADDVLSQIDKTNRKIHDIVGINAQSLRPPYGEHNDTTDSLCGVPVVLWSLDTLDWKLKDADSVFEYVMSTVKDGDIILMHDIYGSSAEAAERLIVALQSEGYQLVTVTELGNARGGIKSGKAYTDFRKSSANKNKNSSNDDKKPADGKSQGMKKL